jgi:LPS export ABC transporter permease LptF/LPS export ABC transporter permease LptG
LRILDRYILKEMAGPFAAGLTVYSFFFLINLLFQVAALVIQQGLSPASSGALLLLHLPNLLSYTLPVALLVGTIVAFGRLSADSEVIAMRAGGLRGIHFLRAPLLFGAGVFSILLLFNLWLIPACRSAADAIQQESAQALNLVRLLKPGVFFDRLPGLLVYAQGADLQAGRYERVFVFSHQGNAVDVLTLADYGRVVRSPDGGSLSFLLENGETVQFDRKKPDKVQVASFDRQALTVEGTAAKTQSERKGLFESGTLELLGRIQILEGQDDPAARRARYAMSYEFHRRFATAIAALVSVLLGVPLGTVNVRGGKGAGFSLSLLVVLVYWVLLSALGDLANAGKLNPWVAAYSPDLLLLAAGVVLLIRRDRMAEPLWMRPFEMLFPRREVSAGDEGQGWTLLRGIKIVDRYLLRLMVRYAALIGLSVLLLDWIIEIRGLAEFLGGRGKATLLLKYLLNQSASIFVLLLPLAILLTVLVTFGILERTNEVTALKASGISLHRLALPALALGAAAVLLSWGLQEAVVPSASRKALELKDRIKNVPTRNIASALDVWLLAPDRGSFFHYNHYDAKKGSFQGFSVYSLKPGAFRLRGRTFLKRSFFEGPTRLAYTAGWVWDREGKPTFRPLGQGTLEVGLERSYFVFPAQREGQFFSAGDLRRLIAQLEERGYPADEQRMDYYKKFTEALSPLVLLLTGLPFAFLSGRKGSLYGLAVALLLVIAYYTLSAVFTSVGVMTWLDPALAAWAPTVLFATAGGYLLLNLRT